MVQFFDQHQNQCVHSVMDMLGTWLLTAGCLLDADSMGEWVESRTFFPPQTFFPSDTTPSRTFFPPVLTPPFHCVSQC